MERWNVLSELGSCPDLSENPKSSPAPPHSAMKQKHWGGVRMSDEILKRYRQNERQARSRASLARNDTSRREWQDIANVWSRLIVSRLKQALREAPDKHSR
jgi:hypothetical protein